MTVINLKTGKVKTKKPKKLPKCNICDTKVDKSGLTGKIGFLPISFCYLCMTGIVQMLMDKQEKQ
jgi:hypothetical protein